MIQGIPLPATDDPLDREFWAQARRGQLVVQCCGQCGQMRFPPRPMCPDCQSEEIVWRTDDGAATVWSFASPSPPLLPAFEALLPYVVVIGALRSNPAIRIAGMAMSSGDADAARLPPGTIAVGQPMRLRFQAVSEDCSLPVWCPDPDADRPGGTA